MNSPGKFLVEEGRGHPHQAPLLCHWELGWGHVNTPGPESWKSWGAVRGRRAKPGAVMSQTGQGLVRPEPRRAGPRCLCRPPSLSQGPPSPLLPSSPPLSIVPLPLSSGGSPICFPFSCFLSALLFSPPQPPSRGFCL